MTASETPAELKFVSMNDTTAPIDCGLEYLETGLASGQQGAGDRWQAAFEAARDGWDLVRAQQLLLLVKRLSLDVRRQSVVRYLEGTLLCGKASGRRLWWRLSAPWLLSARWVTEPGRSP